jgi:hypothetical protein
VTTSWQLNDLVCRYSLAYTHPRTIGTVGKISKWAKADIKNRGCDIDEIPPAPEDIREIPMFRDELTSQLNRSGDKRLGRIAAAMLVAFVNHYQFYSSDCLEIKSELFSKAIFGRIWLEVEDERCSTNIHFRIQALGLAADILEAASFPF